MHRAPEERSKLASAAARFYNEHSGRVTPSTRQQVRAALAVVICLLAGGRVHEFVRTPS